MDSSTPGFLVPYCHPEFAQTTLLSPRICSNTSTELMMPSNDLFFYHPLLLLPSIFPSIRVFSMSWLFASGGQTVWASASATFLPKNIQGWFPLGLAGLISLLSKGFSSLLQHHRSKASILQGLVSSQNTYIAILTLQDDSISRWGLWGVFKLWE